MKLKMLHDELIERVREHQFIEEMCNEPFADKKEIQKFVKKLKKKVRRAAKCGWMEVRLGNVLPEDRSLVRKWASLHGLTIGETSHTMAIHWSE